MDHPFYCPEREVRTHELCELLYRPPGVAYLGTLGAERAERAFLTDVRALLDLATALQPPELLRSVYLPWAVEKNAEIATRCLNRDNLPRLTAALNEMHITDPQHPLTAHADSSKHSCPYCRRAAHMTDHGTCTRYLHLVYDAVCAQARRVTRRNELFLDQGLSPYPVPVVRTFMVPLLDWFFFGETPAPSVDDQSS